mmetsp:Transcript_13543/g.18179  ORF Transcript_13543/g.18179 Transcript_13543/m.18179 type:complete len:252 (+) Transcript_13543:835-1590(+)
MIVNFPLFVRCEVFWDCSDFILFLLFSPFSTFPNGLLRRCFNFVILRSVVVNLRLCRVSSARSLELDASFLVLAKQFCNDGNLSDSLLCFSDVSFFFFLTSRACSISVLFRERSSASLLNSSISFLAIARFSINTLFSIVYSSSNASVSLCFLLNSSAVVLASSTFLFSNASLAFNTIISSSIGVPRAFSFLFASNVADFECRKGCVSIILWMEFCVASQCVNSALVLVSGISHLLLILLWSISLTSDCSA